MERRFSACGYLVDWEHLASGELDRLFETLSKAGFEGIEANDNVVAARTEDEVKRLVEKATKAGVPFTSCHLPFSPKCDIASFYETDRVEAVRLISDALDRAASLDSRVVVIHPTTNSYDVGSEGTTFYLQQMIRSLKQLALRAGEAGLRIAVENMMHSARRCYFSQPEHIAAFRNDFDDPVVGFCLDTGHSLISMGPDRQHEIADAMGDRMIACHLQDNAGDRDIHIAPGRGHVDFEGVFERLDRYGVDQTLCIESAPFAPERPYTPGAWEALIRETRALLPS